MQLVCRISPLVNFHPASEYNPKAAGSRTITPSCASKNLLPDRQSNRSPSANPAGSKSTRKQKRRLPADPLLLNSYWSPDPVPVWSRSSALGGEEVSSKRRQLGPVNAVS
jgi:hypothetical protein